MDKQNDTLETIAVVGQDGRTAVCAKVINDEYPKKFNGCVIGGRTGMRHMPGFEDIENIPTKDNKVESLVPVITEQVRSGKIKYVMPMSEDLFYQGLIEKLPEDVRGKAVGLTSEGSFIEGDKARAHLFFKECGLPLASRWDVLNARDLKAIRQWCHKSLYKTGGGAVIYPYSAGGKGSLVFRDELGIRNVLKHFTGEFYKRYKKKLGNKKKWPVLLETLLKGIEGSITALVDKSGNFVLLPSSMDFPARYPGPVSNDNPVTGGMAAIAPHPLDCDILNKIVSEKVMKPLIKGMKNLGILRPCVIYLGIFIELDAFGNVADIKISEINIRPGEPEMQGVAYLVKNFGSLIEAMFTGRLDEVPVDVRENQAAFTLAMVTGRCNKYNQPGYPQSSREGEPIIIDLSKSAGKPKVSINPSAIDYIDGELKAGAGRVAWVRAAVGYFGTKEKKMAAVNKLTDSVYNAFNDGIFRVIPNAHGKPEHGRNRLVARLKCGEEIIEILSLLPD